MLLSVLVHHHDHQLQVVQVDLFLLFVQVRPVSFGYSNIKVYHSITDNPRGPDGPGSPCGPFSPGCPGAPLLPSRPSLP